MHFGGGGRGGGMHFGGGRSAPRSVARPGGGNRSFVNRGGGNRATSRAANRAASRAAARGGRANPGQNAATLNRNAGNPGAQRGANRRTNNVRNALNSRAVTGALHDRHALHDPNSRHRVVAAAAMAGWQGRHGRNGWWRHRHGGYGWVGPLFWPFAYYDFYNYALWGNGYDDSFWDYGYGDIYAGMFSPYGYDDLAGYLPQYPGGGGPAPGGPATTGSTLPAGQPAQPDQLAQMCGEDGRDIAGLPIDQIQQAIGPNDEQRAALDDLANASVKAAQDIKAACPTSIALTAPNRLAAMQKRIEALIAAVQTVQPPLDKFYALLNDEQKARLTALGQDQRDTSKTADASPDCGGAQSGVAEWPAQRISDALKPTEAQQASLAALQAASAKAGDMLRTSCQPSGALTPPARLAAAGQRLGVMLDAVKTVSVALNDFYGKLTDEQKAQFEAIGPKQTDLSVGEKRTDASDDEPQSSQPSSHPRRRSHHVNIANVRAMIRHFIYW